MPSSTNVAKNLEMIRTKYGEDRREPIHRPDLEQRNKKATRKSKAAAIQVFFATTPNKDTMKALDLQQRENITKEITKQQTDATEKLIQLRDLPPEVKMKNKRQFESDVREQERIWWVTSGFLDLGLDLDALKRVQLQYAQIDMVPEGYMQAELYIRHEEPEEQK